MPRSFAQSDFTVERPVELPAAAAAVSLPERSHEAGAFATRWVMRATFVLLLALAILCLVGPHIPAGE